MSKYDPLRNYLSARDKDRAPMTFAEVERILDRPLPPSARRRAGWWSNNPGTHVGVAAWRDAGWRTSSVDVGAETLVFVRVGRQVAKTAERRSVSDAGESVLAVNIGGFSPAARRLVDDYAGENNGDLAAAIGRAVHEAAIARRGRLIDEIIAHAPRVGQGQPDSVALVREDRDAQ